MSAAIGIWALVTRDFDETGGRTLLTSLTVSGASLLILANGTAITRHGLSPIPAVSAALAAVTVPVLIVAYWTDFDSESLWKTGLSMEFAAIFAAYAVLFSTFESPKRARIVPLLAYPLAIAVATALIVIIWKEWTSAEAWRTFGSLGIALTAVTISSPLLRRLESSGRSAHSRNLSFCPGCGSPVTGERNSGSCSGCGARFRVEFSG